MKKWRAGIALLLWATALHAVEWQVDRKAEDNQVRFTSKVAGFSFDGVTSSIDGYIYWEGEKLFEKNAQLLFQVNLSSFDTGIGKRDRDMRKVLETDKWPKAVFKGKIVRHEPIDSTVSAYRVKAEGRLSLHGVERAMSLPGTIVVEDGGSKIASNFTLRLADFGIEAPSLLAFVKVAQEIVVSASFRMRQVH